jgi:hypothetical protein
MVYPAIGSWGVMAVSRSRLDATYRPRSCAPPERGIFVCGRGQRLTPPGGGGERAAPIRHNGQRLIGGVTDTVRFAERLTQLLNSRWFVIAWYLWLGVVVAVLLFLLFK